MTQPTEQPDSWPQMQAGLDRIQEHLDSGYRFLHGDEIDLRQVLSDLHNVDDPEVPMAENLEVILTTLDLYYELVVKPLPLRTDDEPGHHWQDTDGVVYELGPYDGQFVQPAPCRVVRTRRGFAGEKRAAHPLAKKAAEALGYDLGTSYALVETDHEN